MNKTEAKALEVLAAIDLLREAGWTIEPPARKATVRRTTTVKRVGRPPKKRVGRPPKKRVGRPPKRPVGRPPKTEVS